jgi:hypothetical protein
LAGSGTVRWLAHFFSGPMFGTNGKKIDPRLASIK